MHHDLSGTSYALLQSASGATYLNAKTGVSGYLRVNNVTTAQWNNQYFQVIGGNDVTGGLGAAWTTQTLNSGWSAVAGATLQYKRFGDMIFLRGTVAKDTTVQENIGTLPYIARPPVKIYLQSRTYSTATSGASSVAVEIGTNGIIKTYGVTHGTGTVTYLMFDGMNFSVAD
jgi:hypothetical protein